jgi:pyruvate,water dikinase
MNPVTGNRKEKIITAVYGLGEGLVSGELNADQYTLSENGIQSQLVEKTQGVFWKKDGGTELRAHSYPANEACLSETQLRLLETTLNKLFRELHQFQDVEFCFAGNQFYLLQARPITTAKQLPDSSEEMILWDNSNIIESYPGLTSPLTFSFIRKMYDAVYRQFAQLLGVEQEVIEEEKETFANMLGLIQGRVYYNLLSWYKSLALVPGFSLNAEFMEKMMGVKERFVLPPKPKTSKWKEYRRIFRTAIGILQNLFTLRKQRDAFLTHLNHTIGKYQSMDFDQLNSKELLAAYYTFEETLVKKWKAPLVNDFFAMIYFGTLQKLVVKYDLDEEGGTLHNNLLAGSGDIVSTEPIRLGLELSELIQKDEALKNLFLSETEHNILRTLSNGAFPAFKQKLDSYLKYWGERCVGELKLETITYTIDPIRYLRILKSYVEQQLKPESFSNNTTEILRKEAEKKVNEKLKGQFFRKVIFKYVLKKARYLVSNRENLRYERTRGFGIVRQLFHALGKRWQAEGVLESHRDIFWLSLNEITDFVQGTSVHQHLPALVALRKNEYAFYETQHPSERIKTFGIPYHANSFVQNISSTEIEGDLKGIPCCAGIVRAKVRVVHSVEQAQDLKGCILVTSSTDPGWAPLFPSCVGILVERGSLLSHSAIVSREMGIPCIVGISGLLTKLNDGDEVEMDGGTGKIKIVFSSQ